ncbi:MAG: NAD(P)H-dependent oxidoreductase subunit E [Oscillatoriaceae cyanobacterium Prado104]|nr:NAD(P)H-dependent oxidoreductase subunit E [Oscillatoriaceae cyanobacterium Prado104]
MADFNNCSPKEFCLEGQFLGFATDDGKLKYLRLSVLSEEMQIKIPKAMRFTVALLLQPGESIRVTGTGKYGRAGQAKLKATQIVPLAESDIPSALEIPSTSVVSVTPAAKIGVARSGCEIFAGNSGAIATNADEVSIGGLSVKVDRTFTQQRSKNPPKVKVLVCQKSGCLKRGGKKLCEDLDRTICDRQWENYVTIERTGCLKRCSSAPNLVIMPGKQRHKEVRPKTLPQITDAIHNLIGGEGCVATRG